MNSTVFSLSPGAPASFMFCPICKKTVAEPAKIEDRSKFFPFCGERCKLIDLGRWLGGKYGLPVANRDEDEESPPMRDDLP